MRRTLRLVAVVVAAVSGIAFSIGCGFERSSVLAPSAAKGTNAAAASPTVSGGAPALLGTWTSQDIPGLNSCSSFQFQIASQTATSIAGTFVAICGSGIMISGNATGQLNGLAVTLTADGTGNLTGIPSCAFSIAGNGTIQDNGNTLNLPYSGTTCLGPVHGTEVLHKPQPAAPAPPTPAPTPDPGPAPAPDPAPSPSGPTDAFDLHQAIVFASPDDVSKWPVTATITSLQFTGNGVRVDFTRRDGPDRWPDVVPPGWDGPLEYTLWMVENIGGQWYTAGGVEYWHGLDFSGGPPSQFAANWYYSPQVWGPLAGHQPSAGEQVGFFVTAGDARAKDVTVVRERSNVVLVPFPSDGGATYNTLMQFRQRLPGFRSIR